MFGFKLGHFGNTYAQAIMIQALVSSDISLSVLTYCDLATALALSGTDQSSWVMFSACQGRFYHVVRWLRSRVEYLVSQYEIASEDIIWIYKRPHRLRKKCSKEFEALEMYRACCLSLHGSYAMAIQKAFTVEPAMKCLLGRLVFALEMVRETDLQRSAYWQEWIEDANRFFFELLDQTACEAMERVLARMV